MFKRKQELAELLLSRGIILYYLGDEGPVVFVAVKNMSGNAVEEMLLSLGYEVDGSAQAGIFATTDIKEEGFWCDLKSTTGEKCPICRNEEVIPGQQYCQICGNMLSGNEEAKGECHGSRCNQENVK